MREPHARPTPPDSVFASQGSREHEVSDNERRAFPREAEKITVSTRASRLLPCDASFARPLPCAAPEATSSRPRDGHEGDDHDEELQPRSAPSNTATPWLHRLARMPLKRCAPRLHR